jgi:hypothetical protein
MCVEEFDDEAINVNQNRKAQICKVFQLTLALVKRTVYSQGMEVDHLRIIVIKKAKVPRNRPEGPEGGRGIAVLFPDLGARRGWVVSITPRALYPRERPGTHYTGG